MALFQCEFRSEILKISASLQVIVPQQPMQQTTDDKTGLLPTTDGKWPVLYLLHGLSDNHTAWTRYTSIERYANEVGIAVVMPAANRSFYINMERGPRYFDFVADEVPSVARQFFPITADPEFTFVAGLSMGGYGALKLALTYPKRYAAAASFSGAVDFGAILQMEDPEIEQEYRQVIVQKETYAGSQNDLLALLQAIRKEGNAVPRLFVCCGKQDFLYEMNTTFRDDLQKAGVALHWHDEQGTHEWGYWDLNIQRALKWMKSGQAQWTTPELV